MPKCFTCKKKLTIIEKNIKCRCEHSYCAKHRQPEHHDCQYDYSQDKVKLEKCVKEKIQKI